MSSHVRQQDSAHILRFETLPESLVRNLFEVFSLQHGKTLERVGEAISPHLQNMLNGTNLHHKFEFEIASDAALQAASHDTADLLALCVQQEATEGLSAA